MSSSIFGQKANNYTALQLEVEAYLKKYNEQYRKLYIESSESAWLLNTHIVTGDNTNAQRSQKADEAMSAFTGSEENIRIARMYLSQFKKLTNIQVKQLNKILYMAAGNPATAKDLVAKRIRKETTQTEMLYGYNYMYKNKKVSTNYLDSILINSINKEERHNAWVSSKEIGKVLKDSLAQLRDLRNEVVTKLGYSDYFNYQVSEYGMSSKEMLKMNQKFISQLWPLYRELHTYTRYALADKYSDKSVPTYLPADWLPNRWGQDWSSMIQVKGLNLDSIIGTKTPEWLVKSGENFYVSLGYDNLPSSFYTKSSLYPLPPTATFAKNNHASAWHLDLDKDVRSLMSVEPNVEWYSTVNHELGHIYYYMTYSNPDVPYLLREGANRAYHEAFGTIVGKAAVQKGMLAANGLLPDNAETDDMQILLKEALEFVVFIPFSAGVMTQFEYEMYAGKLPKDQFNKRWWELVKNYQGIIPPETRSELYCDAATKTHINDDPAQYYDYALSFILLFQVHQHIAKDILKQDPHNTNYHGSKEIGLFLKNIMYWGSAKDWRQVLKDNTGSELQAKAMLEYFEPLMAYLKELNKDKVYTLPKKYKPLKFK